jgi:hypothetical protein
MVFPVGAFFDGFGRPDRALDAPISILEKRGVE